MHHRKAHSVHLIPTLILGHLLASIVANRSTCNKLMDKSSICTDSSQLVETGMHSLLATRSQVTIDRILAGEQIAGEPFVGLEETAAHDVDYDPYSLGEFRKSMSTLENRQAWESSRAGLNPMLIQLEASRVAANRDLEGLIDEFIAKSSGSLDACHAQLLETKHQLNQLHQHVHDLAVQVNVTDHQITALNLESERLLSELERLTNWRDRELGKCDEIKRQNEKILGTLREEMEEIKQFASPNVSMNITARIITSGSARLSLSQVMSVPVQYDGTATPPPKVALLQTLASFGNQGPLQPLQMSLRSVMHCLLQSKTSRVAKPKKSSGQSLLGVVAGPNNTNITYHMKPKNVACSMNDSVQITVDGEMKQVSPPRPLSRGETASIPCNQVNPGTFGVVWLSCNGTLQVDPSHCLRRANGTTCAAEKVELERVWSSTYKDLAQLITVYEDQVTRGYAACKAGVEDQYRDRHDPLATTAAETAREASEKTKILEDLRPRLTDAIAAERKLRERVQSLSEQCKMIPTTSSDLNKVRDAIKALSLCPGLTRVKLTIPAWVGSFITYSGAMPQKANDEAIDKAMAQRCQSYFNSSFPGNSVRPASVGEIAQQAIDGLPAKNTASNPLLGACPGCEGKPDQSDGPQHVSGHARICWPPDAALKTEAWRTDCSEGVMSIVCVIEDL